MWCGCFVLKNKLCSWVQSALLAIRVRRIKLFCVPLQLMAEKRFIIQATSCFENCYIILSKTGHLRHFWNARNRCRQFLYFVFVIFVSKSPTETSQFSMKSISRSNWSEPPQSYLIWTWSSLDKEESLPCQITSPFNKKLVFWKEIF